MLPTAAGGVHAPSGLQAQRWMAHLGAEGPPAQLRLVHAPDELRPCGVAAAAAWQGVHMLGVHWQHRAAAAHAAQRRRVLPRLLASSVAALCGATTESCGDCTARKDESFKQGTGKSRTRRAGCPSRRERTKRTLYRVTEAATVRATVSNRRIVSCEPKEAADLAEPRVCSNADPHTS